MVDERADTLIRQREQRVRLMQDASSDCPPESMDAEDMLYFLYTSDTTGKPKGIVRAKGGSERLFGAMLLRTRALPVPTG